MSEYAANLLEGAEEDTRSPEEILEDQRQLNEATDWDIAHMLAVMEDEDEGEVEV